MYKKKQDLLLDDYENEILEAYEEGKLEPSSFQTDFQSIAENTMKSQSWRNFLADRTKSRTGRPDVPLQMSGNLAYSG